MIFSSIHAKENIRKYPKAIQKAIQYLTDNDITTMEKGKYEIDGTDMFVLVMDAQTATMQEKKAEAHKKYIDVQYLATGEERVGFTPDVGGYDIELDDESRDLILFSRIENESFVDVTPGCYTIFFPEDIHRPCVAVNEPMTVRKAVVKIHVSLLDD